MDLSIMTVSLPLDVDTLEEMISLVQAASKEDFINYDATLSIDELTDYAITGFCILAYDDEEDKLVGAISALDRMSTLDFEWSTLVLPSYRQIGIGSKLLKEFFRNLELRGAVGDLALMDEKASIGKRILRANGYSLEFAELTMAADAIEWKEQDIEVTPYKDETSELISILSEGFGDTEDEVTQLISLNTQAANRQMMIVKVSSKVVGTVTLVSSDNKLWVTGLAVQKESRGKGIATSILKWTKHKAYQLGKKTVYLDVEMDNEVALSIYQGAGFKQLEHILYYRRVN